MRWALALARAIARLRKRITDAPANACSGISRANLRLLRQTGSPRTLIGRLGIVTTCATMFLPPVSYLGLATIQLQQRAVEQAALGARHVEIQLPKQHAADWFNQVSINVLNATRLHNSIVVAAWITDEQGATRMFHGQSAWWPEIIARQPIQASDFNGHFNIAVTTRGAILATIYITAAFLVLGLAAYVCFRQLPLAGLDRAQRLLDAKQSLLLAQKDQLEVQNMRFDVALNNMSQGLCMFDGNRRLVVCNTPYVRMYALAPELTVPGTPFEQILGNRQAQGLVSEEGARELRAIVADDRPATKIRELADGRIIAIKHQPMPGGGWLATHEDMTEFRRIEARIAHMTHHDDLTGLPNRALLCERIEPALEGLHKGRGLSVLCLNLDRFKQINDTLGHLAGDTLLKAVGDRLAACVEPGDTVARLAADEFAVLQIAGEQPVAATALAARILAAIAEPFELDGHPATVGVSIGIAVAPCDGNEPDQLLKNADLALDRAKAEGRGIYRFFEQGMDAHMQARCRLQVDLRKALADGQLELYYQPIVNLEQDAICGFEALMRWHHPERGFVSPGEFIPLAEETGLIVPVGEWAIRQACTAAAAWPDHIKIAINLSASQFKSRHLADTVISALASSGMPARRLELEITESVLLQNNEATLATLHQLRALGVRIALDDFGTGYSSLSYLRSFPFDKIKIDRCFVSDLSEAGEDALAILRAVASLGTSLGIATTAEGVETADQLARVREEGCTEMQGYYFSPPRPLKDVGRLFLAQEAMAGAA
jgi:diguanylate cyclase (GGDEF)-like protein